MGLNIKNAEVERLAAEVAKIAGETKTEAIRVALEERKARISKSRQEKVIDLVNYLEKNVWPKIPPELRGRSLSRDELDEMIGYDEHGLPR